MAAMYEVDPGDRLPFNHPGLPPQESLQPLRSEPNSSSSPGPPVLCNTYYVDDRTRRTYLVGRLLGKGGFARCYEVTELKSKEVFACKVVNKRNILKPTQREKMAMEIHIHQNLQHEFIVKYISHFEDVANVYITLELCNKRTLMELQKRRHTITEPEARYFLRQISLAVAYLHDEQHIIHRDLKLGNIFITDNMHLKIGDFGLAAKIEFDGERKRSICGTPNYIAPEVIGKHGHSYEVDIWSIGCILYALLVGRPPFETPSLRETYQKIKTGVYSFPESIKLTQSARLLLAELLQVNPVVRPTAQQIMLSDFMSKVPIPPSLPVEALTMAPRFRKLHRTKNKECLGMLKNPLLEINQFKKAINGANKFLNTLEKNAPDSPEGLFEFTFVDILGLMQSLRDQMKSVIDRNPPHSADDDVSEDPNSSPELWICKWVDYSDKYGFGYQLSDDSIGVNFNDYTKIILLANGQSMHYVDRSGREEYHEVDDYPLVLQKKVKLLKYFQEYMQENLAKSTGGKIAATPGCIARLPNMWTWFRTSRAVVMVLTNGTVQINNFKDHSKLILCPLMGALSTIQPDVAMRAFKFANMKQGISPGLLRHLRYAFDKVEVILANPANQFRANVVSSSPM